MALPPIWSHFGEVASREGPVAELRVERTRVTETLDAMLDRYTVIDVSIQDPPLDQMIARVFEESRAEA